MTEEQRADFRTRLEDLFENCSYLSGDSAIEAISYGMAELVEFEKAAEKAAQNLPIVIQLLDSAASGLRIAGFDYYVSYK